MSRRYVLTWAVVTLGLFLGALAYLGWLVYQIAERVG